MVAPKNELGKCDLQSHVQRTIMQSVEELVKHRWIIGSPPTLEDLVDSVEEHKIGDLPYRFEGGDAEIVAEAQHETAVAREDVILLEDSEDDGEDDVEDLPTQGEVIKLCSA